MPRTYYKGPISEHFDGTHFFNPKNPRPHSFWTVLKWKLTSKPKPWPKRLDAPFVDKPPSVVEGDDIRVSFVGHSTVLIQTQGLNILTDPTWAKMASPFTWMGPHRVTDPGIPFEHLPKIDLAIISHNHYDHLNLETIQKLSQRDGTKFLVPLGNDTIIKNFDNNVNVQAMDWGNAVKLGQITIHLEPSQHWSARSLFDHDRALWGAYIIETPTKKIYFAGDTGYGNGVNFVQAHKKYGYFDLAFLPIGAYEPSWFMKYAHMSPEDAVKAHLDLGSPKTIPIHFGTFHLTDEGYDDPRIDLSKAMKKYNISEERFNVLQIGEHRTY